MIISIELYKCKENANSMSCTILVVLLYENEESAKMEKDSSKMG